MHIALLVLSGVLMNMGATILPDNPYGYDMKMTTPESDQVGRMIFLLTQTIYLLFMLSTSTAELSALTPPTYPTRSFTEQGSELTNRKMKMPKTA